MSVTDLFKEGQRVWYSSPYSGKRRRMVIHRISIGMGDASYKLVGIQRYQGKEWTSGVWISQEDFDKNVSI